MGEIYFQFKIDDYDENFRSSKWTVIYYTISIIQEPNKIINTVN